MGEALRPPRREFEGSALKAVCFASCFFINKHEAGASKQPIPRLSLGTEVKEAGDESREITPDRCPMPYFSRRMAYHWALRPGSSSSSQEPSRSTSAWASTPC